MDEVRLVATLRPAPPREADELCRAARARLTAACGAPRWRPRPVTLAAGTAALAGAALAAAFLIAGPAAPSRTAADHRTARIVTAAWTVQVNRDRTVTITVSQLRDPGGLQRALRQEGIPAIVRYTPMVTEKVDGREVSGPACDYVIPRSEFPPPAISRAVIVSASGPASSAVPVTPSDLSRGRTPLMVFTIRPQAMPGRATVLIQDSIARSGRAVGGFGLSLLASDHLPRCVPFSEWLRQPGQK